MYRTNDTHININDLILNDSASPDGSAAQPQGGHKGKAKGTLCYSDKIHFFIIDETGKVQAKKMLRSLGVNLKESKFLNRINYFL